MTNRVTVVGTLNADRVIPVPRLPLAGDTVVGRGRAELVFGGKGANQAAAAASFGGPRAGVAMVGRVGDDDLGLQMVGALADLGVDVTNIVRVPGPSGTATIAVDPQGQNVILVDLGANAALTPRDVETRVVAEAAALIVQMESPQETVAAALAHAQGLRILNPSPAHGAAGLLPFADVVVPNRTELALLADAPVAETHSEVVDQVLSLNLTAAVVVTLGADGALIVEPGTDSVPVPAASVPVVDTTGAGDCFCGVLAWELARRRSLRDATFAAVRTAALSVTRPGARGRLPLPSERTPSHTPDEEPTQC